MSAVPKAAFYYFPRSIWCVIVLMALEEKGYGADEVDMKNVDLWQGENYDPTFLRINPRAEVPTLVVPLSNTLSEEIDSRYKAIPESRAIVEFLDKSRSPVSRTHTTSSAPAPALAPATVAGGNISKVIIELVHGDEANPNTLRFKNARSEAQLPELKKEIFHVVTAKVDSLQKHLKDAETEVIHVSERVKKLWEERLKHFSVHVRVLSAAEKVDLSEEEKKERDLFLESGRQVWENELPGVLLKISKEMTGPFVLGDQLSIPDLHLAPYWTRVVKGSGGTVEDDGKTAVEKVEKYIGGGFSLPKDFPVDSTRRDAGKQAKLAAFWDVIKTRQSWLKVYGKEIF